MTLTLFFVLIGCNDKLNEISTKSQNSESAINIKSGRLVFKSSEDLDSTIEILIKEKTYTPSIIKLKTSQSQFLSLRDFIIQTTLDSLSKAQLEEIRTEGLEFEPEDSLVTDSYLCSLLNSEREIQIGSKVYKFTEDGIFRVVEEQASLLSQKEMLKQIARNNQIQETSGDLRSANSISLNHAIEYFPAKKRSYHPQLRSANTSSSAIPTGISLKSGAYIPFGNIRDVEYGTAGDDTWLNSFVTNIFGTNTVAINYFSSTKRMRVNFYDEDYKIRRVIGTKVNVQKKKFFIWWNTSADEIRQGWSNIEMKHIFPGDFNVSFPKNPYLSNNSVQSPSLPTFMLSKFPFEDEETVLFSVPFNIYDITNKDLNASFKSGLSAAASTIKSYFKKNQKKPIGLMTYEAPYSLYVALDQNEKGPFTGTNETTFINNWFKGTYVIGFSLSDNFSLKSWDISGETNLELNRGAVYAAVRIGLTWKAARITKFAPKKQS